LTSNSRAGNPRPTCKCKAYTFPHRLVGGKCTGEGWVEHYFNFGDKTFCNDCPWHSIDKEYDIDFCRIIEGDEGFVPTECPALLSQLRRKS